MLKDIILKNRSYRRFYQDEKIELETLKELVDLARLSACSANKQALKFVLSNTKEKNEIIFSTLSWAGYLKDWEGPTDGEKPAAYIVIVGDRDISNHYSCDHGIVAQSILLGAVEKGYGGCMLGAISKDDLKKSLNLDDKFDILLVLALGKPKETVVIEKVIDDDIRYWRDENNVHHVPKRDLNDLIIQ